MNDTDVPRIIVTVHDGKLRIDAPIGVLTPDLCEMFAACKQQILDLHDPARREWIRKDRAAKAVSEHYRKHYHQTFWRSADHPVNYWVCVMCHPPLDGQAIEYLERDDGDYAATIAAVYAKLRAEMTSVQRRQEAAIRERLAAI